jgi:hypothetical protein
MLQKGYAVASAPLVRCHKQISRVTSYQYFALRPTVQPVQGYRLAEAVPVKCRQVISQKPCDHREAGG